MFALPNPPVRVTRYYVDVADVQRDVIDALEAEGLSVAVEPSTAIATLQNAGVLHAWLPRIHPDVFVFPIPDRLAVVVARWNTIAWTEMKDESRRHEIDLAIISAWNVSVTDIEDRLHCAFPALCDIAAPDILTLERLAEKLTGCGVNGRLLQDRSIAEACRALYDDELRADVRSNIMHHSASLRSALKHGLWLELLVSDIVARFTKHLWTGFMAHLYETDVIALVFGQLVLCECKAKSLGQKDYMVAAQKARYVNADLLLLITTAPLHPNVWATVEADLAEAHFHDQCPPYVIGLSDLNSTAAIAEEVCQAVDSVTQHAMKNWLREETGSRTCATPEFWRDEPGPLVPPLPPADARERTDWHLAKLMANVYAPRSPYNSPDSNP